MEPTVTQVLVPATVLGLGTVGWLVSRRALWVVSGMAAAAVLPYAASSGADAIARSLLPGFGSTATLGKGGWVYLVVVAAGIFLVLDHLAAGRESPTVEVRGPAEGGASADAELAIRRRLTEELRFVLPAVNVTRPGGMPGASSLDRVAAIGSIDADYAKQAMAVTRLLAALRPRPRSFQVSMFVECCDPDGRVCRDGALVRLTVDLRDARTAQAVYSTVSGPLREADAAEWAAAVVARQVLQRDAAVPRWALGSPDGEDLRAYLTARTIQPLDRTYGATVAARAAKRALLEGALRDSREGGVARYELAALEEIGGRPVHALRQHLLTRRLHPGFRTGRYRAAMSLSMVAGQQFAPLWGNAPVDVRRDIGRCLDRAGLLRRLEREGAGSRHALIAAFEVPEPGTPQLDQIRRALLDIAVDELDDLAEHDRIPRLLWSALVRRAERADLLVRLRHRRGWSRLRRGSEFELAADIARVRRDAVAGRAGAAALAEQQRRWRKRLGLDKILGEGAAVSAGKLPWKALYNAACLQVLQVDERPVPEADVREAVELLRLAVGDPACGLDRPSEWLATDLDLRHLRGRDAYVDLIRGLAAQDFDRGARTDGGDPWLWTFVGPRPSSGTRWVAALVTSHSSES